MRLLTLFTAGTSQLSDTRGKFSSRKMLLSLFIRFTRLGLESDLGETPASSTRMRCLRTVDARLVGLGYVVAITVFGPGGNDSLGVLSLREGSLASRRIRVASRSVISPPHHSTISRNDNPSRSVMTATPARRGAQPTEWPHHAD
jgi:hypothetical protein